MHNRGHHDGSSDVRSFATGSKWWQIPPATTVALSAAGLGIVTMVLSMLLGTGPQSTGDNMTSAPAAAASPPTMLLRAPRVFESETALVITVGSRISATGSRTKMLLGNMTPWVRTTQAFETRVAWDAELASGTVTYGGSVPPGGTTSVLNGSVAIDTGAELYVQASSESQTAVGGNPSNPFAFPIIVTRGPVNAGSIGTSWFVWGSDATTTYFVLLGATSTTPPGSTGSALHVGTCTDCLNGSPSACCRILTATDTYVKVTMSGANASFEGPADLSSLNATHPLLAKVTTAKLRAQKSGLRP